MKRKYSIGIVCGMLLVCSALFLTNETEVESLENNEPLKNQSITTQGEAEKEEIFYLQELNGYIVVYKEDKKTIFEYTNINIEELPHTLAKEIREWKRIDGEMELYGFLENFSS